MIKLPKLEELKRIGDNSLLLERTTGKDKEFYALNPYTLMGEYKLDYFSNCIKQDDWLVPLLERLITMSPEEKATVYTDLTYGRFRDASGHTVFPKDVSFEVHGKMNREDVLKAKAAAINEKIEREFIKSGELAERNKKIRARIRAEKEQEELEKVKRAERLKVVNEKIKDEKLDVEGRELWFYDYKESPDTLLLDAVDLAERWGKLMQIEMRKNHNLLTKKTIHSTFEEASLGRYNSFDRWNDDRSVRLAYHLLAFGWKHGNALSFANTNGFKDFLNNLKQRNGVKNENYRHERPERLKELRKYTGGLYSDDIDAEFAVRKDGIDYLTTKQEILNRALHNRGQEPGKTGNSSTGTVSEDQINTTVRQTRINKTVMKWYRKKQNEGID